MAMCSAHTQSARRIRQASAVFRHVILNGCGVGTSASESYELHFEIGQGRFFALRVDRLDERARFRFLVNVVFDVVLDVARAPTTAFRIGQSLRGADAPGRRADQAVFH